jgi:uncharacterized membrane protein YhhN
MVGWWLFGGLGAAGYLAGLALGMEPLMQFARLLPHLALLRWWWAETANDPLAPGRFGRVLALLACAAADFVLRRPQGFIPGLYGFLIAQVAFIAAFTAERRDRNLPAAFGFLIYAAAFVAFLWPNLGDLRLPVIGYALALATMGWRAWATESSPVRLGGLLFVASDSLLAIEKFAGSDGQLSALRYPVVLTYWAALALLMARSSRDGVVNRRAIE